MELVHIDTVDGGLDAFYLDSELPSVAQFVLAQENSAVVFYLQGWGVPQDIPLQQVLLLLLIKIEGFIRLIIPVLL